MSDDLSYPIKVSFGVMNIEIVDMVEIEIKEIIKGAIQEAAAKGVLSIDNIPIHIQETKQGYRTTFCILMADKCGCKPIKIWNIINFALLQSQHISSVGFSHDGIVDIAIRH